MIARICMLAFVALYLTANPILRGAETNGVAGSIVHSSPQDGLSIRLNFRNAPMGEVLSAFSSWGGFTIVAQCPVSGVLNLMSQRTLSEFEAVEALRVALLQKGFELRQKGKRLDIFRSEIQLKSDGFDGGGETLTVPIFHLNAKNLVRDLSSVLPAMETATANETLNTITVPGTANQIDELIKIIPVCDTTGCGGPVGVFPLRFASVTMVVKMLRELYHTNYWRSISEPGGFGGGTGDHFRNRIREPVVSPDVIIYGSPSNLGVFVYASPDVMPGIEAFIEAVDVDADSRRKCQAFHLKNSDVEEMANLIVNVFPARTGSKRPDILTVRSGTSFFDLKFGGDLMVFLEKRTASLAISASPEVMARVVEIIAKLEATPTAKASPGSARLQDEMDLVRMQTMPMVYFVGLRSFSAI